MRRIHLTNCFRRIPSLSLTEKEEIDVRRITFFAIPIFFALALAGFSPAASQSPRTTSMQRRIQVNAQTIKALGPRKTYVVDLTKRGVFYQFDSKSREIDFSRVRVRTANGEVAIRSYLERFLHDLKDQLPGFNFTYQSFSLGTQPRGRLQSLRPVTSHFKSCNQTACICTTQKDCEDLADSVICINWFCVYDENDELICSCTKVP